MVVDRDAIFLQLLLCCVIVTFHGQIYLFLFYFSVYSFSVFLAYEQLRYKLSIYSNLAIFRKSSFCRMQL